MIQKLDKIKKLQEKIDIEQKNIRSGKAPTFGTNLDEMKEKIRQSEEAMEKAQNVEENIERCALHKQAMRVGVGGFARGRGEPHPSRNCGGASAVAFPGLP